MTQGYDESSRAGASRTDASESSKSHDRHLPVARAQVGETPPPDQDGPVQLGKFPGLYF